MTDQLNTIQGANALVSPIQPGPGYDPMAKAASVAPLYSMTYLQGIESLAKKAVTSNLYGELTEGQAAMILQTGLEMGIPPRDTNATRALIPEPIYRLRCYQAFPTVRFGMVGPAGCGKSNALVNQIKKVLLQELDAVGPENYQRKTGTEFRWVGWPAFAARMKNLSARREWEAQGSSTNELMLWLATEQDRPRVLIMDDIGMENLKPDSYTTEQLELLIDRAYGLEARLFWTSNKTVEQLNEPSAYGPRLISRLTGLSPDACLPPDLPDLRNRRME